MTTWSRYLFLSLALLSSLLAWHQMIYYADTLAQFYSDEVANVQASDSFFSSLSYHSDQYGYVYSSGPAVTWPGGLGWKMGHTMLASRICCAFFSWSMFLALGVYFFHREGISILIAFLTSTILWAATITPPLAIPYWFGFIYNLGELNSILLIGWGLMFISRLPMLSAFIFGLAVWHGKIIYLPLVSAILLGDVLAENLSVKKTLTRLLGLFLIFISPLILWTIFTYLRFDMATTCAWLEGQLTWFSYMTAKHKPLTQLLSHQAHWLDRFSSPDLEWSHYSIGNKIKNILFSLGAILMTGTSLVLFKKSSGIASNRTRWISFMALLCLAGYSFHFFFLHPYMWQRHFQPGLYCGFALWVLWGTKWVIFSKNRLTKILIFAMVLVLAMQLVSSLKHPLFSASKTYARTCTDLRGPSCNPVKDYQKFFQN